MRVPSRTTSRPGHLVCPTCEAGGLRLRELHLDIVSCASRGFSVEGDILRILEQITTLPDGMFRCPACGSEVLPFRTRRSLGSAAGPLPSGDS